MNWIKIIAISSLAILTYFEVNAQEFYFKASGELTPSITDARTLIQMVEKKKRIELKEFNIDDGVKDKIKSIKKVKYKNDSTLIIKMYIDGLLRSTIKRIFTKQSNGTFEVKDYSSRGVLLYEGMAKKYLPLIKQGESSTYYANGSRQSKEVHSNNKLVTNLNWMKNGQRLSDNIFTSADVLPSFEKGPINRFNKYVADNIELPNTERLDEASISVIIQFTVRSDGQLEGIQALNKVSPELEAEAARVVKSTSSAWSPAEIEGIPINIKMTVPISFSKFVR